MISEEHLMACIEQMLGHKLRKGTTADEALALLGKRVRSLRGQLAKERRKNKERT